MPKKKHAVSDGYLQQLWRKACLLKNGNRCIICGKKDLDENLQVHHIVHRRQRILRHDVRNGVVVHTIDCHEYADSLRGRAEVAAKLGAERMEYLADRELRNVKDWLLALSFTRNDLELFEKDRLKEEIRKYQED